MFSQLVVVVLLGLFGTSSGAFVALAMTAVTTAVSVINEITSLITGMPSVLDLLKTDDSVEKFQNQVLEKLNEIHQVCGKIDDVAKQITTLSVTIEESTKELKSAIEFNPTKIIAANFKKNMDFIDTLYDVRYNAVSKMVKNFRPGSVSGCPQAIVTDISFVKELSELYSYISASLKSQSNILTLMSKYYETRNGYKYQCENITPMDDLHFFVGKVIVALSKGYGLLFMCQDYLGLTAAPNDAQFYRELQNSTLRNFQKTIEGLNRHAIIVLNSLHTNLRGSYSCDPSEWNEGKSFIRIKNYISFQRSQKYIDKYPTAEELALSKEVDCRDGFAEYLGAPGTTAGTATFVCLDPFDPELENPNLVKYEEIQNPQERIWESRQCTLGSTSYDYYSCIRDQNSDPFLSIRKLSLRLQECDTTKNEVVTDARFHEQDNKIHIKLRCGISKDGKIIPETLRWTEDRKPFSEKEYVVLSTKVKSFLIDNLYVAPGELLTGAGFRVIGSHYIGLVVKGHKVKNYNKETTFGEGKEYVAALKKPRKNIDISGRERLPKKVDQTYEMSEPGEHSISLTLSKYSNYHNNRAIIPYLDMTPYNPELSVVALSGLGLMYKSYGEYAGLLAFKHLSLVHINFSGVDSALSLLQAA